MSWVGPLPPLPERIRPMASTAQSYLINDIQTASPQRRHLMLLEAALRYGRQTGELWSQGRIVEGRRTLFRLQEIVAELAVALKPDVAPELVRQVGEIYLFVTGCLERAIADENRAALQDALRILEAERRTWQLVCARTDVAPTAPADGFSAAV
jgi:flagellar protein FliS